MGSKKPLYQFKDIFKKNRSRHQKKNYTFPIAVSLINSFGNDFTTPVSPNFTFSFQYSYYATQTIFHPLISKNIYNV